MDILLCALILVVPTTCVFLVAGIVVAISTHHQREHQRREFETLRNLMS